MEDRQITKADIRDLESDLKAMAEGVAGTILGLQKQIADLIEQRDRAEARCGGLAGEVERQSGLVLDAQSGWAVQTELADELSDKVDSLRAQLTAAARESEGLRKALEEVAADREQDLSSMEGCEGLILCTICGQGQPHDDDCPFVIATAALATPPSQALADWEREVRVKVLEVFDAELKFILAFMPWESAQYAAILRKSGMAIPSKCEAEQAAVMHWMLRLYIKHGPEKWREEGTTILKEIEAKADRLANGEAGREDGTA